MISPKVSTYAFNKPGGSGFAEGVAGIMWQSTPSPLTPAIKTALDFEREGLQRYVYIAMHLPKRD